MLLPPAYKFVNLNLKVILTHEIEAGCITELALHEELGVFAALRPQFNLFVAPLVHLVFEAGGEMRLRLISIEGSSSVFTPIGVITSHTAAIWADCRLIEVVILGRLSPLIERVLPWRHTVTRWG